jgi:hypothetical protein
MFHKSKAPKMSVAEYSHYGVRPTFQANESLAGKLRPFGVKPLARRIGASIRTIETWFKGETAPTWKHISQMLADDELMCEVLRAAGREDIAELAEMKRNADQLRSYLTKGMQ